MTVYDDPRQPPRSGRPPQGQRCPACGHTEPDLAARFCGACGASLPGLQSLQGPGGHGPADITGRAPAQPPVQYGGPLPSGAAGGPVAGYGYGSATVPAPASAAAPITYTIPSVGFAGPARLGAAVSAAFTLVPCVLFAFLGSWAIHAARRLLDSWLTASIAVPIPIAPINLPMNFVDLLRLRGFYDRLIYWDDHLWLAFAIFWLVPWLLWIVAGVLFALLLAAIYNMVGAAGGGVRVRLAPVGQAAGPVAPQPAPWPQAPPAPPPGWQQPGWPPDRRG